MLNKENALAFKDISPLLFQLCPDGVGFALIEEDKIVWQSSSNGFSMGNLKVGTQIKPEGGAGRAIREKKTITVNVPKSVYGARISISSTPIWDGEQVSGALSICLPQVHPVIRAFNIFAPIMVNMFPEGAIIFVTDLESIVCYQASSQLDIAEGKTGADVTQMPVIAEAVRTKTFAAREHEASLIGVPILIMSYPLFDEVDTNQVIGTLTIILPKKAALQLREASSKLEAGTTEISAVMEELAASASQINSNELQLNRNIQEVHKLSEDINGILAFIKQIADQTKMLGLNAAIEAARAGEIGRGFGVVAEEIRKLSDESKDTVASIRNLTDRINVRITETINSSDSNMHASEEQAAGIQEVTASIQEITSLAAELDQMAKNM